jgi:hypothetical protein
MPVLVRRTKAIGFASPPRSDIVKSRADNKDTLSVLPVDPFGFDTMIAGTSSTTTIAQAVARWSWWSRWSSAMRETTNHRRSTTQEG